MVGLQNTKLGFNLLPPGQVVFSWGALVCHEEPSKTEHLPFLQSTQDFPFVPRTFTLEAAQRPVVAPPPWVPGSRWRAGLPPWLSPNRGPQLAPRGHVESCFFFFFLFYSFLLSGPHFGNVSLAPRNTLNYPGHFRVVVRTCGRAFAV